MKLAFIKMVLRILDAVRHRLARCATVDATRATNERFISRGENSSVEGAVCEVRNSRSDQKHLIVGRDSVVAGVFVFEIGEGKVIVGNRSSVGGGMFVCIDGIEIGDDVMISWGCTFVDNNSHSVRWSDRVNDNRDWKRGLDEGKIGRYKDWSNVKRSKVVVKDKVWIGFNCIILKGVTIGEGAVVAAGSVVTKSVPEWVIVGGNPATVLREIAEEER